MNALTFNKTILNPVNQNDNQIWLTSKDLSAALGYKNSTSLNKIYNANKAEFTDSMTMTTETVVSAKNKGLRAVTRVFSLRGCHAIAMFARTEIAKDFRIWVLDVLDNEVASLNNPPVSLEGMTGLVKCIEKSSHCFNISLSESLDLVHHRFNIDCIGELSADQVIEATEYVHRLMLDVKSGQQRNQNTLDGEHLEPIEQGTTTQMANQFLASGKFVGTIGRDGRMAMRELSTDEVIVTVDMLPHLIETRKINVNVLSRIALNANQQLYAATYGPRPAKTATLSQGEWYEC